jgi:hypothetical protein
MSINGHIGWKCPECGTKYAPSISSCSCRKVKKNDHSRRVDFSPTDKAQVGVMRLAAKGEAFTGSQAQKAVIKMGVKSPYGALNHFVKREFLAIIPRGEGWSVIRYMITAKGENLIIKHNLSTLELVTSRG